MYFERRVIFVDDEHSVFDFEGVTPRSRKFNRILQGM